MNDFASPDGGGNVAVVLRVDDWLRTVQTVQSRAPMPWWSLRDTRNADLRAMYAYIRSPAPLGEPAPAFVPAGQVPPLPYQLLPEMAADLTRGDGAKPAGR